MIVEYNLSSEETNEDGDQIKAIHMILDNTPFPDGINKSKNGFFILLDYEALDIFILKENIYNNSQYLYTFGGSLILIFCMLCVVLGFLAYKFHKVNQQLKKEAETFKTSFMMKNSLFTSVARSESRTPAYVTRNTNDITRP